MHAGAYILDLDGTLMPTHDLDNRCYWQAVHDVFGTGADPLDLGAFHHVTDDAILNEWSERTLERTLTPEERQAVCDRFLDRLEEAADSEPEAFHPFAGLTDWLEARAPGTLAIATGGWRRSATFKLAVAGLDRFDLPLAGSDDAPTRIGIMQAARRFLAPEAREATPTYLGDGAWDLAATRTLAWDFIGIASGDRARALERAGARRVLDSFLPLLS
jgi:phosphoglycolate phosphatase-like HAD superfamily hydrolase